VCYFFRRIYFDLLQRARVETEEGRTREFCQRGVGNVDIELCSYFIMFHY
jgi:hypothetical protein